MVQYCFTSTETIRLVRTVTAQDGHIDPPTAPELCDSLLKLSVNRLCIVNKLVCAGACVLYIYVCVYARRIII